MSTARNDPRILSGMETQLKIRQNRLKAGEKPIGWKVGFGAPAGLESLEIDAPLIGFLTEKTRLPSAATANIAGWTKAIAEPEIVVYLGQDLAAGADRETARAAIAALGPAIELADINFPPDDVAAILAGNIYHRQIIFGRSDSSRAGCVLKGLVGRVYHNGMETKTIETRDLQANTGDLVDIVRHVANMLPPFGEKLREGDIIITGSIIPAIPISGEDEVRFTLDPVDTVSINIEA